MGRSAGYRPRVRERKEVERLRAKLYACRGWEWGKANDIMKQITRAMGKHGPSGYTVLPRVCSTCDFFGHTAEHCKLGQRPEQIWLHEQWAQNEELRATDALAWYNKHMIPCVRGDELRAAVYGETRGSGGEEEVAGDWDYAHDSQYCVVNVACGCNEYPCPRCCPDCEQCPWDPPYWHDAA